MIEKIGKAAMLEQLAEECTELAKAALKRARIERGENPTPIKAEEADRAITEEYTDIVTCAHELHIRPDKELEKKKRMRFDMRWQTYKEDKDDTR